MATSERVISADSAVDMLIHNLSCHRTPREGLPPKQRFRELQRLAFGNDAVSVTEMEYRELIGKVRKIRQILRSQGKTADEHPSFKGTDHPIYWLADNNECERFEVSVELKQWEQSAGHFREPYPKFSLGYEDSGVRVSFELNFDDTYNFSFADKKTEVRFDPSGLKRAKMRRPEYQIINHYIRKVADHFGISSDI